jgi:hypothetical protein
VPRRPTTLLMRRNQTTWRSSSGSAVDPFVHMPASPRLKDRLMQVAVGTMHGTPQATRGLRLGSLLGCVTLLKLRVADRDAAC